MEDLETHDVMASALIERGLMTQEQATAERASLEAQLSGEIDGGFDPLAPAPAKPAAPEGVDELTAAAFEGPANAGAYNFGAVPDGAQAAPEQEMAFRELFHSEQIPASIGNEVGRLWNAAAASPPSPQQLEAGRQQCEMTLRRQWGANFDANLAAVRQEVNRMAQKNSAIPEMLTVSGLGNNAWLATTLLNVARAKGRVK